jgi:N-acetyl-alpha-D-muramate 1-phosphate uridylyltransferase
MPQTPIDTAMVLAAGLGKRMRPITDRLPKPLVEVGGKALLDYALDRLAEAGIGRVVVNVHHLADQIERHVRRRAVPPAVTISDERDALLETGGGVKRALPLLGRRPFLALNSDSLWVEGGRPNLPRLLEAWDPARMDILLLLAPKETSVGFEGDGDFHRDAGGRLIRREKGRPAPFIYAGVAVLRPELFGDTPDGAFSLNLLFDRAIAAGRLFGLPLEGQWLHVGTPESIPLAEERLMARAA